MSNTTDIPTTTRVYRGGQLDQDAPHNNFETAILLSTEDLPKLGPNEVLLEIHAVSLNWRDIMILTDTYLQPMPEDRTFVPISDGAGKIVAIGSKVTRFQPADRVAATFFPKWIDGLPMVEHMKSLGAPLDGMLREYAVMSEEALVKIPDYLSFEEASTLPCAGLTAWNALFGHGPTRSVGRCLRPGESVLTQGSGGVSLFAAQIALAAGAEVIATTSSAEKAKKIESLVGVPLSKIINYREVKEWGKEVKKLSPDGEGVDIVIEVTGDEATLKQSYAAARLDAQVSVIGARGAAQSDGGNVKKNRKDDTGSEAKIGGLANVMQYIVNTRRLTVGNRAMFEVFNRFLDDNKIHPIVDDKIFDFEEAREALMYLWQGKQFGNIVIRIKH